MSDLEDLDHEPEPIPLDEELHSDEHIEEELSPPAEGIDAGFSALRIKPAGGVLLKIAIVAVVLVGGGAYVVLSSHHDAKTPLKMAANSTLPSAYKMPPPKSVNVPELVKNAKSASPADPLAWSGSTTPAPYPPSAPAASTIPLPTAIPAPAAMPTVPAVIPPSAPPMRQAGVPFVASPPAPSIVNEMPPPMAQLTNVGGAMPLSATTGSAMHGMTSPAPHAAAPAQANTFSPFMPQAILAPVQKQANQQPAAAKEVPLQVRNGEPMPSATVPAVDKVEISKTPVMPAPEPAKVEALEKEIADLKKTISQLQQASVMKEETVEKTAEVESAEEPAPSPEKPHHHTSHHKSRHVAVAHHATAAKWVLKAAKPGVAWIGKKGSDDLRMVETGDFLTGIGKVTAIVRDSSGYWVVNGTKGRISQ